MSFSEGSLLAGLERLVWVHGLPVVVFGRSIGYRVARLGQSEHQVVVLYELHHCLDLLVPFGQRNRSGLLKRSRKLVRGLKSFRRELLNFYEGLSTTIIQQAKPALRLVGRVRGPQNSLGRY